MDESLKLVVVGDGAVGKTSMLQTYSLDRFPETYQPTVFDNYNANTMWKNQTISLGLWDTAGQDDYDRLRPLSYPDTHVFLVCYSVTNPNTLHNMETKWIPEIKYYCPNTPFVVVGTKLDMRDDESTLRKLRDRGEEPVTAEKAREIAMRMGAYAHFECSAKLGKGLKETFNSCISAVLEPNVATTKPTGRKKKCLIM